jgi:hypothetical protein
VLLEAKQKAQLQLENGAGFRGSVALIWRQPASFDNDHGPLPFTTLLKPCETCPNWRDQTLMKELLDER